MHRDQLGGVAADDRAAEHDAGGRVGEDLHEAARVVVDQRLGRRRERHLGHPDLAAHGERLGLGQADVGDLGLGEDGRRRLVVVEVAVLAGVQAHHVLGDLAALHGGHRRQRQLPRHVAGGVDVADVRLAVVVDRDVAAAVDLDAGGVEAEALGVGDRADGQQRVGALDRPPVVAAHHDAVVDALDARGPGALQQRARPGRGSRPRAPRRPRGPWSGSTCWRLTISVTLDAERREHVDELDAGDARADHDEVLGQHRRRVGVAGGEDALAVGLGPVGDAGPGAGRRPARRRPASSSIARRRSRRRTSCGPVEAGGARRSCARPGCASSPRPTARSSRPAMPSMRSCRLVEVDLGVASARGPCPAPAG